MRRRSARLAWVALLLLAPGCGEQAAPPRPAVELPLPQVAPVPEAERVRYALERLERGPAPLGGLVVPNIHRRNLELAEDDLIALEREAQRQLAEPARIARVTSMAARSADPWHNVLRVLLGMDTRPADLVLAWTRPVLETPEALATLRLEATRVLAALDDSRAAPVLLELFRRDPADREIAPLAFASLLRLGGPERAAAMDVALRRGGPDIWSDAWARIGSLVLPGEADRAVADLLAWWCALAASSGPRLPEALPFLKSHPWMQARIATDDAVPRRADGKPGGLVYGPIGSHVSHGGGWFATDMSREFVLPLFDYLFTGKLAVAEGRCVLARWGHAPYVASVRADLLLEDVDEGLYYAAKHCMLAPDAEAPERARRELEQELDRGAPWDTARVVRVQGLLATLGSCDAPGAWALLERALFGMHPLDLCRPAIEEAFRAMGARPQDLVPLVAERMEDEDPAVRGVALHLARRARDPAYAPALESRLDRGVDDQEAGLLKRTLAFIYSGGSGVEPVQMEAFVQRYLGWLDASSDREFAGLATGLLDLREPGVRAFAEGLRGPRRDRFLAAWPRDRRIVPLEVAVAAMAPVDADAPAADVSALLVLAYTSFPAEAAAHLEALRRRVAPAVRPLFEPVMERVSHRAPVRHRVK